MWADLRRRRRDRQLYAQYGEVMREAQHFELVVRELVVLSEDLEEAPAGSVAEEFDIGGQLDRLFRRPLAKLARGLGIDEELAAELQAAVSTRNTLAHEFLIVAFIDINIGRSTHREQIDTLGFALGKYRELGERLGAHIAACQAQHGIDPEDLDVSAADMRRMLDRDDP